MEREPRKEITLEQANEIAKRIRQLEKKIEGVGRSTQVNIIFSTETAITHKSGAMGTKFAEEYIKDLYKRLDQLKKERENSILIDW